jgi:Flp pilus assembly protein TadD
VVALAGTADPSHIVLPASGIPALSRPSPVIPGHNRLALSVLESWSLPGFAAGPAQLSVAGFLRRVRPAAVESAEVPAIFAVVDQLERAVADVHDGEDFLHQLVEAVETVPGLHLLLSVREDSLPDLAALEGRLGQPGRYRLGPLRPDAALEAVVGPLHGTGVSFAPGAAEEVVHNLRTSRITDALGQHTEVVAETVEPVQLQVACTALTRTVPGNAEVITVEHVYGPGDLDGAMVEFCARAVHEVAVTHDLPDRELWGWLVRAFVTDLGTRGTAYQGVTGIDGMPAEVASHLADRHVLMVDRRLGSRWYQLPNDRLIGPVREAADRWVAGPAVVSGTDPVASLVAAEGALAEGNLALAARRANEAVRTSGGRDLRTRATALSCLGHVAVKGGQDQEAESHYRAAAELFEVMQDQAGTGRLLAERGRIFLRRGRYAEAVAELQGAEARLPSDLAIQIDLARALRDSGQLWAATAVLGATLTVAPGTVEALVERGLIRIETGEFSYALDDLDNAIRLLPSISQRPEIRSARAIAQARLGRTG